MKPHLFPFFKELRYLNSAKSLNKNPCFLALFQLKYYSDSSAPPFEPIFGRVHQKLEKTAVVDQLGTHTYSKLYSYSRSLKQQLDNSLGNQANTRISFLCPSDIRYVGAQWACWLGGNVAVPLYHQHPDQLLEYYIKDSQTSVILASEEFMERIQPLAKQHGLPLIQVDPPKQEEAGGSGLNQNWDHLKENDALMMYTSGTTGPPKGVVLTYGNIHFQVHSILKAWEWTSDDVVLHALPLHHTHGIISGLLSPLYGGATCLMLPKFDPAEVWKHFLHLDPSQPTVNIFMAVPTMYVKLIEYYDKHLLKSGKITPEQIKETCSKNMRVMVSGSASLPQPVLERFKDITGVTILERYGMTEIGVSLSNPLHGKRFPGCVGYPTAGVEACIAKKDESASLGYVPLVVGDEKGSKVLDSKEESGELFIRGGNVFKYYWNRPEVTAESFTKDGWFMTGDTAQCIDGVYKILGRSSADIIKTGGYKVSALDVERHLLSHPDISECTVIGAPDETWGERVAAVVVLKDPNQDMQLEELRLWCKQRMAPYTVPTLLYCVPELKRNFLGKVNKKELIKTMFPGGKK